MKQSLVECKWVGWAIVLAVVVGAWQALPEIEAALELGESSLHYYGGPLWIKAIKDVLIVSVWILLVVRYREETESGNKYAWAIYAVACVAVPVATMRYGVVIALAGLRWLLPILLFVEFRRIYGKYRCGPAVISFLLACIAVNLFLQISRFFDSQPIYGVRWSGFPSRVPGLFVIPNTTAFFSCACASVIINATLERSRVYSVIAMLMSACSCLLAQSGGGIAACFVLSLFVMFRRVGPSFVLVALISALWVAELDVLLEREGFLAVSGGERLDKFLLATKDFFPIGSFGLWTNSAYIIRVIQGDYQEKDSAVISDSLYTSLVGNLGLLSIVVCYCLFKIGAVRLRNRANGGIAVLLCILLFGFSTPVTEAFPMSLILIAGFWSSELNSTQSVTHDQNKQLHVPDCKSIPPIPFDTV